MGWRRPLMLLWLLLPQPRRNSRLSRKRLREQRRRRKCVLPNPPRRAAVDLSHVFILLSILLQPSDSIAALGQFDKARPGWLLALAFCGPSEWRVEKCKRQICCKK